MPGGGIADEFVLKFDQDRRNRILVVPALLDEANKLRRFTVEIMRRLDGAGHDCFLPDLPGCNESVQDLYSVEAEDWATAIHAAARQFSITHVLAIRGGGLLAPPGVTGWHYAPVKGATILKTLLRARIIASRERGQHETTEGLLARGVEDGLDLSGYHLSSDMIRQLHALVPAEGAGLAVIDQDTVGGSALWLRAEPEFNRAQADALAAIVAVGVAR